ncbi:MAG: hypothetical protein OXC61_04960, partial [Flavobacteriaceae bacterium]|nr:hypothetical protein [Flavobacteriaceae bacterium]
AIPFVFNECGVKNEEVEKLGRFRMSCFNSSSVACGIILVYRAMRIIFHKDNNVERTLVPV